MKCKATFSIVTCIFIMLIINIHVNAAQELAESNQVITGYNAINDTSIVAYSAFRTGDVGSGTENFATITSQYNQPRYESSVERVHHGTDMQALSGGLGRKVFSAYDNAKVVATQPGTTGYGNYVTLEHKHTDGGVEYYFRSHYAHLASRTLTTTTTTYTLSHEQQVGVEGDTGVTGKIHLHQEFRVPGGSDYRYAPSVFYWQKGAWGNNTSFINLTEHTYSTVTFNIVSYDNGIAYDVPSDKVRLYYKIEGSPSNFTSVNMTKNGNSFSYNFNTLGLTPGTNLKYYVEAQEKRWEGTYCKAYRPYYDRLSNPPPEANCFTHMIIFYKSAPESDNIESEKTLDELSNEVIASGGVMEPMVDIPWEPVEESVKNGIDTMNISFIAQVQAINDDKNIIVTSVTDAELCEKNEDGVFYIIGTREKGENYNVLLNYDFTPEVNKIYKLKGHYDKNTNEITVYDYVFLYELPFDTDYFNK